MRKALLLKNRILVVKGVDLSLAQIQTLRTSVKSQGGLGVISLPEGDVDTLTLNQAIRLLQKIKTEQVKTRGV